VLRSRVEREVSTHPLVRLTSTSKEPMPRPPLVAKLANMRKAQKFSVYPRDDGRAPVTVQSDRAIGRFDPLTGEGVLNWRGSNAKYFQHLSPAFGAEAYTFPPDFVAQALANEPLAGDEVGPGIYTGSERGGLLSSL
jgi:hypothetical protein